MIIIDWIKGFFSKAISLFKEFIKEAFPVAIQIIIGELKEIAIATITDMSKTDLTNEEKRKEAFKRIKNYACVNGIEAKDAVINALIELAVLRLKATF